jgi:hypothetical protein
MTKKKNEETWDEFSRNTPSVFWDVAAWPRNGSGYVTGSLDVADRKRIVMSVLTFLSTMHQAPSDSTVTLRTRIARVLYANQAVQGEGFGTDGPWWEDADSLLPLISDIVQDQLTSVLHPEFGTEWREPDGIIYKAVQQAKADALREAAEAGPHHLGTDGLWRMWLRDRAKKEQPDD